MNIIITIDDNHLKDIDSIARSLSRLGFKVESVLRISGVISGSLGSHIRPQQLKIKGVKSIEFSRKVSTL